jgi:hypothetical protein
MQIRILAILLICGVLSIPALAQAPSTIQISGE